MLEIRLLGDIAIVRDGEVLDLPKSRKTLALLAYLLVTGRSHHRERLCALLWELPDDPRGSLRWSLSKLRSLVDEPDAKRIVGEDQHVMIELLGAEVDVLSLRQFSDPDIEAMSAADLEALMLCLNGNFLENLELPDCHAFQAWRTAEQSEVAVLQARVLEAAIRKSSPGAKIAKDFVRQFNDLKEQFPEIVAALRSGGDTADHDPLTSLDLRGADGSIPLPDKPSIAVLPFENLSDEPDQDYFTDGITEDIITALSKFSLFFVSARNSTFAYKGQPTDVKKIARELGVQYVLEGSARRSGSHIRVTAQLIDGTTGHHVWAERYDREVTDIFAAQDDLTGMISTSIGPEVMSAEMNRAHQTTLRDPNARELYLRGMWHYARFTEADNQQAISIAEEGICAHPEDAELYTMLALAHQINFMYGWRKSRQESMRCAIEAARIAIELDAVNPLIYRCLAVVHLYAKQHDLAIAASRRSIELNPNDSDGHANLGAALGYTGDYSGALLNLRSAVRLSPRDPFLVNWYNHLAHAASIVQEDDIALEWTSKMRRDKPSFPGGYRIAAVSLVNLGRVDEARSAVQQFLTLAPGTTIEDVRLTVPIAHNAAMDKYLCALSEAGLPD